MTIGTRFADGVIHVLEGLWNVRDSVTERALAWVLAEASTALHGAALIVNIGSNERLSTRDEKKWAWPKRDGQVCDLRDVFQRTFRLSLRHFD